MARFSTLLLSYMFGVLILFLALRISKAEELKDSQFVKVKGAHFTLNGSPYLFNGFNAYWLMNVATEPNDRYKVSEVLKDASAAGLSVCRTWAFNDGAYNALQKSPGVYDEHAFQALDFVLSEARKYGIRLILSFVNNYNDFGGKAQYVQWARNTGEQINNDDEFYTNPVLKQYYKNHIMKVVTRYNTITGVNYRDDPTIFSWELMNEPRCQADYSGRMVDVSINSVTTEAEGWIQEMATFVKSLDNKHLLEVGMEGFYGDSIEDRKQYNPGYQVGTDFITNHQISDIDFATIHAYTDQWEPGQSDDAQLAWLQRWITSHWQDATNILKKPLVLAEFGKSSRDGGYTLSSRDNFMSTVYRTTYNLAKSGGTMAGSLVWQLMAEGMDNYYDGYEIVLSQTPSTAGIIAGQSNAMTALSHLVNKPDEDNNVLYQSV